MIRWGLLGTSFISETMAGAIAASPGSTMTAVFGRDKVRLAAFAERHGIARRHPEMESLVTDPAVDVVYVGLPNHRHAVAVELAAKAGKAILSEKSLATTMADANRLAKAVRSSGVFFLEGLMYLCHPMMADLLDVVASGQLGEIRRIHLHYAADIWQVANPEGKGTIFNLGCYPVSLLHAVMVAAHGAAAFEDRTLSAHGNISAHDGNIVDAAMTIRFGNGVLAQIGATDCHGMAHLAIIEGSKGRLVCRTNPWLPEPKDNVLGIEIYGQAARKVTISTGLDAFGHQVRVVEQAVSAGRTTAMPPAPDIDRSMAIMALLCEWEAGCL